jgi:hypothetical protein
MNKTGVGNLFSGLHGDIVKLMERTSSWQAPGCVSYQKVFFWATHNFWWGEANYVGKKEGEKKRILSNSLLHV